MDMSETVVPAASCATFDCFPDPTAVFHPIVGYTFFNSAWKRYGSGLGCDFTSKSWTSRIHDDDIGALARFHKEEKTWSAEARAEIRIGSAEQGYRWFLLRSAAHRDAGGALLFYLHILSDIHNQKVTELDLRRQLRYRDALLDTSTDCIKLINNDGSLAHMNAAGCTALCVPADSGFGMDWLDLLPPEISTPGQHALEQAKSGTGCQFHGMSQSPGEDPRYWDNRLTPLLSPEGRVEAILCVSRDITATRQDEHRIGLLLREVSHRSRNMLTVIRALVRRTAPTPQADFVSILDQRLISISRSFDLLMQDGWTGVTIRQVVASQTITVSEDQMTRLHIQGASPFRIRPDVAEKLGLAIHELTTNAIRHGAFSNDQGRVSIAWELVERDEVSFFHLTWKETGGPAIVEPVRKGFGAALIERNPRGVTGATVDYHAEPDGILWRFTAPALNVLTLQKSAG